jgi:hypothetical protein
MTDPRLTRTPTALAWAVYCVQMVLSGGMALVGLIPIVFSDSCGSVSDEPAVCDTTYAGTVLITYWIVLALLPRAGALRHRARVPTRPVGRAARPPRSRALRDRLRRVLRAPDPLIGTLDR